MKRFRGRKVYGESRIDHCAFCGSIATQKNDHGVLVCRHHLQAKLEEIKCTCGSWLEQRSGKFGPYFNCLKCGNINFKKGMEMKAMMKPEHLVQQASPISPEKKTIHQKLETHYPEKKEITIRSDDPEYFD